MIDVEMILKGALCVSVGDGKTIKVYEQVQSMQSQRAGHN